MNRIYRIGKISLLSFFVALLLSACNKNDDGSESPLTNESIIGKKFCSDKILYAKEDRWIQIEIRFMPDGMAYLQNIYKDYDTGEERRGSIDKATYYLDYPEIDFYYEKNGRERSKHAHFVNNESLVFDGQVSKTWFWTDDWGDSNFEGIIFKTNPSTIANEYTGQKYVGTYESIGGYDCEFTCIFGSTDIAFRDGDDDAMDYLSYSVQSNNITFNNGKGGGYVNSARFVNDNTIEVNFTKYYSQGDFEHTAILTRER